MCRRQKFIIFCMLISLCINDTYYTNLNLIFKNLNLQDTLSPPLICDDLMGIQHKDIGKIQFALQVELETYFHMAQNKPIETFTFFKEIFKTIQKKEDTIFTPADMQFFFGEAKQVQEGIRVMCRIKDKYGTRTYYAVFSLIKNAGEEFPIRGIYTESEYVRFNNLTEALPHRTPKDIKAIDRYIQQEKGIDEVIKALHKSPYLERHISSIDSKYKDSVQKLTSILNIRIETPEGLLPIEKRKVFIVQLTPEIKAMLEKNKVTVVDENGNEIEVIPRAHSSNNAVHFFLEEDEWEYCQQQGSNPLKSNHNLLQLILHEIGVMCGLPPVKTPNGRIYNEIELRWQRYCNYGGRLDEPVASYNVVNLDATLLTRDYAAGLDRNTDNLSNPGENSINNEINKMVAAASQGGKELCTHPDTRYTLLVISDFFANGEFERDRSTYGDRFNLHSIESTSEQQFVDKILAKASGIENRSIALVPESLNEEQLTRLLDRGIRFIRTNTNILLETKLDKPLERKKFQQNTYAMMLLARSINKNTTEESVIYRLLNFYIKSHFQIKDDTSPAAYINAIIDNNLALLIKGLLSYRPIVQYELPDYDKVALTLISA